MKRLPLRTLFALALMLAALAARLPARGGFVPSIDQPGSCAAMPYGLVGCWSGDGNTNDATGNHNATWNDTPLYVPGVHGQAFNFNAWNRVIVPDAPDLRVSSAFTLSAWINPNAQNNSPETGGLFSKVSNSTGLQGFQTALVNNNQTLVFLFNAPGQAWPGNVLSVDLPQPLPIGQWAHVAFTFDGQDMRIYLNAQVIGTLHTGPTSAATSTTPLMISGDGNNNVKFRGAIDEAAVFNRALSGAEIAGISQLPLHITTL